ncbi:hypothetical protein AMC94_06190 [Pseudomonas amygdali pv. aesculi]|nr:hypothetical protein PSYAE_25350 [Pseudomonas amygdali pv. aesculi str. 0893_23]KPW18544.1 hypothetical protein ALO90_102930 [Pseudomonas amygdali pv. aesculi]KWT13230.1 hypothetical protein AL041_01305 [Pseudomonas amygdali pv. aesculi]KWT17391.1 hypothetical protein AL043_07520 [Pseudomonas amygdali pv. aesculi]KWT28441.1 hypothetical protein AL042_11785 [Pseudomonas amygdali pv. aesculi]
MDNLSASWAYPPCCWAVKHWSFFDQCLSRQRRESIGGIFNTVLTCLCIWLASACSVAAKVLAMGEKHCLLALIAN